MNNYHIHDVSITYIHTRTRSLQYCVLCTMYYVQQRIYVDTKNARVGADRDLADVSCCVRGLGYGG